MSTNQFNTDNHIGAGNQSFHSGGVAPDSDQFYRIGGTLPPHWPSYVERQADKALLAHLEDGEFCYVLTSRQMGKSSLMARTAMELREQKKTAVVSIDLTSIGKESVTPEQWYDGLQMRLGEGLKLRREIESFWYAPENQRSAFLQRFMRILREVVLARIPGRIVIFIDEIDYVRSLPFSTDEFFAGIRAFYNARAEDPELNRLTFCLLGVATPSDLIHDVETTPFNIGRRIELTDFTESEPAPLIDGLGRDPKTGGALLKRILYWTGGHPYLTQRLCLAVAQDATVTNEAGVDRICKDLFLTSRSRTSDDNLLFVSRRILGDEKDHSPKREQERAALLDLYKQVRSNKRVLDDQTNPLVNVLRLSGIVRADKGYLRVRNHIYEHVFDHKWITDNMPDAEIRRQRAAYRRGFLRAVALAVVILAVVVSLASAAVIQRNQAVAERQRADETARKLQIALEKLQAALEESEGRQQEAKRQKGIAESQRQAAVEQREIAERKTKEAEEQQEIAEAKTVEAREQRGVAEAKSIEEARQREIAETKNREALEARSETNRNLAEIFVGKAERAWLDNEALAAYSFIAKALSLDDNSETRGNLFVARDKAAPQARVLWESLLGSDEASDIVFSPDGRLLSSNSPDQKVHVWSVSSGAEVMSLTGHTGPITKVAFSPDGHLLASASKDKTIRLWDVVNKKELYTLTDLDDVVTSMDFREDGKRLASGDLSGTIRIWDIATGKEASGSPLRVKNEKKEISQDAADSNSPSTGAVDAERMKDAAMPTFLWGVAFSSNGTKLASIGVKQGAMVARRWDVESGVAETVWFDNDVSLPRAYPPSWIQKILKSSWLRNIADGDMSIASPSYLYMNRQREVSPDGRWVIVPNEDGALSLLDRESEAELLRFGTEGREVGAVYFCPDGQHLAALDHAGRLQLWELKGKNSSTFLSHNGIASALAFSPDMHWLASGGADSSIQLWDIETGRSGPVLNGHAHGVTSLAFKPGNPQLASGAEDGTVRLWDIESGRQIKSFPGPGRGNEKESAEPVEVALSPDGQRLAATSIGDDRVWVWDLTKETTAPRFFGFDYSEIADVAYSPDGLRVAVAGGSDNAIRFYNSKSKTKQLIKQLMGVNESPVLGVTFNTFNPNDSRLAARYADGTVLVWNEDTNKVALTLPAGRGAVHSVAFRPGGQQLITASDEAVTIWDARNGNLMKQLSGNIGRVVGVAYTPDGKRLATAGEDRLVRLWDADSGQEERSLPGHQGAVLSVAFSPNGKLLASASADKTVRLWDAATGQDNGVLSSYDGEVRYLSFSSDSRWLATGGEDGNILLWDLTAKEKEPVIMAAGSPVRGLSISYDPPPEKQRIGRKDKRQIVAGNMLGQLQFWEFGSNQPDITMSTGENSTRKKGITSVAFSPDGRLIATGNMDKSINLWDSESGKRLPPLRGSKEVIARVLFSEEGKHLIAADVLGGIHIWDVRSGQQLLSLGWRKKADGETANNSIYGRVSVALSHDEQWLAVSGGAAIRIFDLKAQKEVTTFHRGRIGVMDVSFSRDGRWLASSGADRTIRLWDLSGLKKVLETSPDELLAEAERTTRKRVSKLELIPYIPADLPYLREKGRAKLAEQDWQTALVYLNEAYRLDSRDPGVQFLLKRAARPLEGQLALLSGHTGPIKSAAISTDNSRVVTASEDGTAKVWDVASGQAPVTVTQYDKETLNVYVRLSVNSVAISHDGSRIVTGGSDGSVKVWDAKTGALLSWLSHRGPVNSVAFNKDGSLIVTASSDGRAIVWDGINKEQAASLTHDEEVTTASFSEDGTNILTATRDGKAMIWNAKTSKLVRTLVGHSKALNSAAFSEDGRRIITAGEDKTAKVWDAQSGTLIATLNHAQGVKMAAFSPDGLRAVTASDDHTAKVWDASSGELLFTLADKQAINSARFASNKRIFTASSDMTASLWDAENGRLLASFAHGVLVKPEQEYEVSDDEMFLATLSPDGSRVVTAGKDGVAIVWDAAAGTQSIPPGGSLLANRFPPFEGPSASFNEHSARIETVAFSPDGTRVVSSSWDKTAKVWDAETGEIVFSLEGHTDRVYDASFSPDGTRILSASPDNTAKIWDAKNGHLLFTLQHKDRVRRAKFSPDGKRVVTASRDQTAQVWDVATGKRLLTLAGHQDYVREVAFSPDGKLIATSCDDTLVRVWDATTGNLISVLKGHTDEVNYASFSPDNKRVATASADKTVRIWDAMSGTLLFTLQHTENVNIAEWSPDGRQLATGQDGRAQTTKIWNPSTGQLLQALTGQKGGVASLAYSPDGTRLATGSGDRTAWLWEAATGKPLAVFERQTQDDESDRYVAVVFSPDGKQLAMAGGDARALIWNTTASMRPETLVGHHSRINVATFSPDGARALTASDDGTAKVWNVSSGELIATMTGHTQEVASAAFDAEGRRILTTARDNKLNTWDAATGKILSSVAIPFERHKGIITSIQMSRDGTRLLTSSDDATAKVWDALSGKLLFTLEGHKEHLSYAEFSPNDALIVTSSWDNTAKVWEAATGKLLATLAGHSSSLRSAVFSPDSQRVLTSSDDGTARVWEAASGKQLQVLKGHLGSSYSASFDPKGMRVVTIGTIDKTAKVWDANTGQLISTLHGNESEFYDAQFSPDATRIVTAGQDKTARVWDTETGKLLATLGGHGEGLNTALFSPDGRYIVTGSFDRTAKVWDAKSYKELSSVSQEGYADFVAFSPDSLWFATSGRLSGVVNVWETASGKLLTSLTAHKDAVRHLVFSRDSKRLVTASDDGTARVWNITSNKTVLTLSYEYALSVSYTPSGARLLTADKEGRVTVWDADSNRVLATLVGHDGNINSAVFSSDGKLIITSSADGTAKVWEAASGKMLGMVAGHTGAILYATFSRDGKRIVTAGSDHTAKVWETEGGKLLLALRGHRAEVQSAAFSQDGTRIITASQDQSAIVWDATTGKMLVPLAEHDGAVLFAQFNSDGTQAITGGSDHTARLWDVSLETRLSDVIDRLVKHSVPKVYKEGEVFSVKDEQLANVER